VALIGIIAAIAIPSLLRARISANESAAITEITTVVSAEAEYAKQHGRFASVACLAAQPGCQGVPASPPLLDAAFTSSAPRHGYNYRLKLSEGNAAQFAYTAVPVTAGQTGRRSFCADSSGMLGFSVEGGDLTPAGAACSLGLSPLGGS
jgi:type IV pilus assembly protein PilA